MELTASQKFAFDLIVEREESEIRAMQAEQARRFTAFKSLLAEEHHVPQEFIGFDPRSRTFFDMRVTASPEEAPRAEGPPRRSRRKSNGDKPDNGVVETDVGDIVPVA